MNRTSLNLSFLCIQFLFSVIALTYDLESSLNGTEHLRKSPVNTIKVNQGFGDDKITNLAGKNDSFKFDSIKSGSLSVKHHVTNNRDKL